MRNALLAHFLLLQKTIRLRGRVVSGRLRGRVVSVLCYCHVECSPHYAAGLP